VVQRHPIVVVVRAGQTGPTRDLAHLRLWARTALEISVTANRRKRRAGSEVVVRDGVERSAMANVRRGTVASSVAMAVPGVE